MLSIVAAYFTCSDTLRPFLLKYLETAAYDKRRAFHGEFGRNCAVYREIRLRKRKKLVPTYENRGDVINEKEKKLVPTYENTDDVI